MTPIDSAGLDRAIASLPDRFRGPGGAVAVVRDGEVLVRHAWGYSDLERRTPFATTTLVPICSVTKQFTCAVMLDAVGDPARLDPAVTAMMPGLSAPVPRAIDLANNQSGLRDYWALTVLCGAAPESDFRPADAFRMIGRTRTLHFQPGTRYSYSNGNFRMLASAIEEVTGQPFKRLLIDRVLDRVGMSGAVYEPETSLLPGGAVGYDGDQSYGYVPGINRIHWSGDAGLCATLEDMIAWERFIDRTRDDAEGLYARLSVPPSFSDGLSARYGLGLSRGTHGGRVVTGHGGALRGWRCQRLHVASERLSVVVLFNHAADPHGAAVHVLAGAIGADPAPMADLEADAAAFIGSFLDQETGILLDVAQAGPGRLSASYSTGAEPLSITRDGIAEGKGMRLRPADGGLLLERPGDNLYTTVVPVRADTPTPVEAVFGSEELGTTLRLTSVGGAPHALFDGILGQGAAMPLYAVGSDLWRMPCQRSLDAPSPGDWTVRIERGPDGRATSAVVGCWLARDVRFKAAA